MATPFYASRVWETGTLTATSTVITLPNTAAVISGDAAYRTFSTAAPPSGALVCAMIAATTTGGSWEQSMWTYTSGSPGTLTRVALIDSSTGATINWSGVPASIMLDMPPPSVASSGTASAGFPLALDANGVVDPSCLSTTILDVSNGPNAGGNTLFSLSTKAFVTVPLPTVNVDTAAGWNAGTNQYTVPNNGVYLIVTKLRPDDNTTVESYGQGANFNNNIDGAWFHWANTPTGASSSFNRGGTVNTRIVQATAGQLINMYAYIDGSGTAMVEAGMNIVRID